MNIVGKNIKERREALGLSQDELAKKMGYKNRVSVCKAETGKEDLTTARVRKFADALGCTPADLMGWTQESRLTTYYEKISEAFSKASEKDKKAVCTILDIPYGGDV